MGPSVPLMITWLLSDVPCLDGEALQEKQLFINSDRTAAGTWYPSNTHNKNECFLSTYVSVGYRLPVDKVNYPSLVSEEEYNIMIIFFHIWNINIYTSIQE